MKSLSSYFELRGESPSGFPKNRYETEEQEVVRRCGKVVCDYSFAKLRK